MNFSELDIWATEAGTKLLVARPSLVMQFFGGSMLNASALAIFKAWRAMLPAGTPLYYIDYDARRFRKLTLKALERVEASLATASTEFLYFFFKDAPDISLV